MNGRWRVRGSSKSRPFGGLSRRRAGAARRVGRSGPDGRDAAATTSEGSATQRGAQFLALGFSFASVEREKGVGLECGGGYERGWVQREGQRAVRFPTRGRIAEAIVVVVRVKGTAVSLSSQMAFSLFRVVTACALWRKVE